MKQIGNPSSTKEPAIERFVDEIKDELKKGYGFTPFVGSGVSAASGMLMGRDFDSYLLYAVFRCVAPVSCQDFDKRWDLHRDGWLRLPKGKQYKKAEKWLVDRYNQLVECHEANLAPPFSPRVDRDVKLESCRDTPPATGLIERFGAEDVAWRSQMENARRRWKSIGSVNKEKNFRSGLPKLWKEAGIDADEMEIIEKALRSLYDWKAILAFLSHVVLEGDKLTYNDVGDPLIIDRFNLHITWGQKPNLAHTQLVHLARPMRIRQIFTTNFDTLIEQAYDEVKIPLRVIETTTGGSLPDPSLVLGANCLVKLHGGSQQTRADFTLNQPVSDEDQKRFISYLQQRREVTPKMGGQGSKITANIRYRYVPNHLLMIGFSGSDRRIIGMIQGALWALPDLKLFCIANSARSEKTFKDSFRGWHEDRVKIFVLGRADLALLRLYQELALSLPPGGFMSQFGQCVPAGESPESEYEILAKVALNMLDVHADNKLSCDFHVFDLAEKFNSLVTEIDEKIELGKEHKKYSDTFKQVMYLLDDGTLEKDDPKSTELFREKLVVLRDKAEKWQRSAKPSFRLSAEGGWNLTANGSSGVMRFFQVLFELEAARRKQAVWLELEDYESAEELPSEILRLISINRGRYQTAHVDLDRHPSILKNEAFSEWVGRVLNFLDLDPGDCAIFLYGRNGPGGCSGLHAPYWGSGEYEVLEKLLLALEGLGFRIYYLPFSKDRWNRNLEKEGYGSGHGGIKQRRAAMLSVKSNTCGAEYRRALWAEEQRESASGFDQRLPASIVHDFGALGGSRDTEDSGGEATPKSYEYVIDQICSEFVLRETFNPADEGCWQRLQENAFSDKWENEKGDDTTWKRLQFLYACTLFRQSRHPSALISEGSFACPASFNTKHYDNDSARAEIVKNWIHTLRRLRLFRDKPGGYLWLYRDTRLGIQSLIESLSDLSVKRGATVGHIGERRARTHFWIAEWYRDALMATRNLIPMIESLYHRCAAIRFAKWAKPTHFSMDKDFGKILQYRVHLVVGSLTEIADMLEIGEPMASFWQPGELGSRRFSRASVLKGIECSRFGEKWEESHSLSWLTEIVGAKEEHHEIISDYAPTILQLLCNLTRAADSISSRVENESAAGFATLLEEHSSDARKPSPRPLSGTIIRENFYLNKGAENAMAELNKIGINCFGEDLPEWIFDLKACRERDLIFGDRDKREVAVAEAREKLAPCILKSPSSNHAYLAIQALSEAAYVRIKYNKLVSPPRSTQLNDPSARTYPEVMRQWVAVTMVCSLGLSLLRVCHSVGFGERVLLRQKFLAFYALALGFLGRFHEAHRRLNLATAICRYLPEDRADLARIILRIRRAEIHLLEAEKLAQHDALKEQEAYLAAAKVDDAVVSLEAAEFLLQGRSQSSLWWGRFFSLKLRALSLSPKLAGSTSKRERVVSLAMRRRYDYYGAIREIFGKAELLCEGDTYRLIRTVDYTISAVRGVQSVFADEVKDDRDIIPDLDGQNSSLHGSLILAWKRLQNLYSSQENGVSSKKWCEEIEKYYNRIKKYFPET